MSKESTDLFFSGIGMNALKQNKRLWLEFNKGTTTSFVYSTLDEKTRNSIKQSLINDFGTADLDIVSYNPSTDSYVITPVFILV